MVTTVRASKGTVKIKNSNGRLQLVFSHAGKRHYLSLGLPDSKVNRKAAAAKAKLIEADLAFEKFDPTLAKYKPQALLEVTDLPQDLPQLDELWEKFIAWKRPQCSPSTMKTQYRAFSNYVERLPTHNLNEAPKIRDWVLRKIPIESAKRFIVRLNACCKWAVQSGLIEANPFEGMAKEIKKPKSERGGNTIHPFSKEERDLILHCLENNMACSPYARVKHSYYWAYVKFLLMTGCRPNEATALCWKHIDLVAPSADVSQGYGYILFEQGVIDSDEGRVVRSGLKTQKSRRFPVNRSLWEFLRSIKPDQVRRNSLVFPALGGGWLHTGNFTRRVWPKVLEQVGIKYRKLYQCRHSFITWCLESGIDAKDVAAWVGNSPAVIYTNYAGAKRGLSVPEL